MVTMIHIGKELLDKGSRTQQDAHAQRYGFIL